MSTIPERRRVPSTGSEGAPPQAWKILQASRTDPQVEELAGDLDRQNSQRQLGGKPVPEVDHDDTVAGKGGHAFGEAASESSQNHSARDSHGAGGHHPSDPQTKVSVSQADLRQLGHEVSTGAFPCHRGLEAQRIPGPGEAEILENSGILEDPPQMVLHRPQVEHQMDAVPANEGKMVGCETHPCQYRDATSISEFTLPILSVMTRLERLLELIDRFSVDPVVLVGDLVLDRFVLGSPKRISREAPVIILRYEGERNVPGGGANALANLAALDVRAIPVAVVGDDEPGSALTQALADRGVDLRHVVTVPGYRTPTKIRILGGGPSSLKHQVARYDIEDQLSPTGAWTEEFTNQLGRALEGVRVIAMSDYGYGTVSPATVACARQATGAEAWICIDSRYGLSHFTGVSGATPNLEELEACADRALTSDEEVAGAAEELRRRLGARFLLATRGNRGMTLVEESSPPRHLGVYGGDEVADVTGAGDTVLAVLCASLAAGATPLEAARLANYAGGLVVMKLGTATISRDELRSAVRSEAGQGNRP